MFAVLAKVKSVLMGVGVPENLCLPVATMAAIVVIATVVYFVFGNKLKEMFSGNQETEVQANDNNAEDYEEIEEPFEDDYETDEDDFESDLEEAFENIDDEDEDFNSIGDMNSEEMQALGQL